MRTNRVIIVVAVLLIAFVIEGLKHISGFNSRDNDAALTQISLKNLDVTPFHITKEQMDKQKIKFAQVTKGMRLSGAAVANTSYDFSEGHKNLTESKDSDLEKPKEKKKKKRKKKAAKQKNKDREQQTPIDQETEESEGNANDLSKSAVAEFTAQLAEPPKNDSDLPVSFEDWAKLILGRPQPENVDKLVEFFANNMVSADVFFAILNAMLEEKNKEQSRLAVYAAGSSPHPQSFQFLMTVAKDESRASELVQDTIKYLETYQSLSHVHHLAIVLSQNIEDASTVHAAINILDRSTETHLEGREPAEDSIASPISGNRRNSKENRLSGGNATQLLRAYSGFESVLNRVIEFYSTQSQITQPATTSLSRIKNLIVTPAPVVPAPVQS